MAMISIFLFCVFNLIIFQDAASLSRIDTIPSLSNNILATGYPGLIVKAQIEKKNILISCIWQYGNPVVESTWYSPVFGCLSKSTCAEENINGIAYLLSNLTFDLPITSSMNINVLCDNKTVVPELHLKVQDCLSSLPFSVSVKSTGRMFKSIGTLDCTNNGKLFYSNGTELPFNQTTCLASAQWSGQDNLQCWTAPIVSLSGDLSVIKGSSLNVLCLYEDVIPTGSYSSFYFENSTTTVSKNKTLVLQNLQPEDNNKVISCQAVTPYTQMYNNTGRSMYYVITVLYNAYQKNSIYCHWRSNQSEICNITFLANPKPQFVSVTKCGSTMVTNDGTNNISTLDNNYFQFVFYKKKVTFADDGYYYLSLSSPIFSDVTIAFTISVVENITPSYPHISESCNHLSSALIAVSCIAAIAVAAVIGLLVELQRISRNNTSKTNTAVEKNAFQDDKYVEIHSKTVTGIKENKLQENASTSYIDMKTKQDSNLMQAFAECDSKDILPMDDAGYVDLHSSSSVETRKNCIDAEEINTNEASDFRQNKSVYENIKSVTKNDGYCETMQ